MFGPLGITEVVFILVLALLIFGPRKLPEMGRTIGRALGEFRRASNDLKRSLNAELDAAPEPRANPRPMPEKAQPREEVGGPIASRHVPAGVEPSPDAASPGSAAASGVDPKPEAPPSTPEEGEAPGTPEPDTDDR